MPWPGPGTEDSVTPDSDLQQSRCWALLPAVSSLTVMPKWTCPATDTGLGGIHFKLSPRFPGRSLAAALPIRARGGSSDNSVLWVQAVIQIWSCNIAAVLAQASVISNLQAGTSYRYTVQPQRHTFNNVLSKSFCHWLKSDSMWAFHIECLTSSLSIQLEYQLCAQLEFQLIQNCNFTLNPVEIAACSSSASESLNLIHFHFFRIAWMINYIWVVSF